MTDLGFVFTDASYSDPLGPQMERPKTAAARKQDNDDLFDEDVGDDLLPEWGYDLRNSQIIYVLLDILTFMIWPTVHFTL